MGSRGYGFVWGRHPGRHVGWVGSAGSAGKFGTEECVWGGLGVFFLQG